MAKQHPQHPLTPPPNDHSLLRQVGQHLMPPNAGPHHQHGYFEDQYVPSVSSTSYNSPQPNPIMVDQYGQGYARYDQGLWNPYEQDYPQFQDGAYPMPPVQYHTYPNPTSYGRGPRTPEVTDQNDGTRRTARQRKLVPNHVSRGPSPARRRKVAKKENSKRSRLEKPLSELTKHLEHITIKDTAAWVNRSFETRQNEKGTDGFIKRPSNSFILYRSAYADRCREYEKSNNHQDISSMAGASWAVETPEIRKQYEEWAKLERINHQAAFPNYKFQPQTAEAKARKRKGKLDDTSEEPSDADDPTYHQGRGDISAAGRATRVKKQRRNYREPSSYSPSLASHDDYMSPEPYLPAMQNPSYYHATNPGKPMPAALSRLQPGGYYQSAHLPSNARFSGIGHVEDIGYSQADVPTSHYGTPPPMGLPGALHEDLIGDQSLDNGHLMIGNASLDPQLLSRDQDLPGYADPSVGFQASDYLEERDQIDFANGTSSLDAVERWDHFDERN